MQMGTRAAPMVLDVEAELAYWRAEHAAGRLGKHGFGTYALAVKSACDVWLHTPRANEERRLETLRERYELNVMSRLQWDEAADLAKRVWRHLGADA
ncbi:hypothetical protein [Stenotrophomonas sp. Marseille-Q4652]|uniref:hypothetical protein n=1 Tax=Stenotrophomonas sp. Marseille-Q4652 TaxID=2866595 RepID=UPI001CE3DC72|nr:hypothetical protein [Stenotrophomonas sp. Marseille-Q4652]